MAKENKEEAEETMYIGSEAIKHMEYDGDDVTVTFEDHDAVMMNSDLLQLVMRPVKNEGTITDAVIHVVAAKYLDELSGYGLEFYMVENVTQAMRTYAHNLREEAIADAFDCTSGMDMRLDKLTG